VQGEVASADAEAEQGIQKIWLQQLMMVATFNGEEMAFSWQKIPCRTGIAIAALYSDSSDGSGQS